MSGKSGVNNHILSRLSEYLLILEYLLEQRNEYISSRELSLLFGNTASQIRQDFSYIRSNFSNNYRQGYNIEQLIFAIKQTLGLNSVKNVGIVGAGNLGQAIGRHVPFTNYGMKLAGLFDMDTDKKLAGDLPLFDIDDLEEIIEEKNISIIALCIPGVVAQGIVNRLVGTRVKSILNFARMRLKPPAGIIIKDQQMICSFMQLCHQVEVNKDN